MYHGNLRVIARYILGGHFYTFTRAVHEIIFFGHDPIAGVMDHFRCTRPTAVHLIRKYRREAAAGTFTRVPLPA